MTKPIAERKLPCALTGSDMRKELIIRIDAPYIVNEKMVNFPVSKGLVGCHIEVEGLEKTYQHEVYGVDDLQAINIATNIEPFLERLSKEYDLYWPFGESYFEE